MSDFHKLYSAHAELVPAVDELSAHAIEAAQCPVKDAKVIVLESLLLEAISGLEANMDNKKAKSAISAQKTFISSNVMNINDDDVLPQILKRANELCG